MTLEQIIKKLKSQANPKNVAGMARFGINSKNTLGVSIPIIRSLAKTIGCDHSLALKLWATKIHEARILAALIDDHKLVTTKQMDSWVRDFDSWDICDQVCSNLFDKTPFAWAKAIEWSRRKEEFIKRAGFVLMATLAVHDKQVGDKSFLKFFPYLRKEATDPRNFVKKAVNWALRQIGKRSLFLNIKIIALCREIQKLDSTSAKWIASDALRELREKSQKLAKK
ncbi:MAG TPA: DNA alkylation repair protein [Patescibacteria group bacterium]|nr:DNA alkylation repair protein [Patescibacteria group bacterium]